MAFFFTITLLVSIAALAALMILKQIELSTGTVILAGARPKVNLFFKTCLIILERVIPGLAHGAAMALLRRLRDAVKKLLAHAILRTEAVLHRVLHFIREKTHPAHARGEASAFLRQVGEYKKQLEEVKEEEAPASEEKAL